MPDGPLVIIGGHEDRSGKREILSEVARRVSGGRLVLVTVASRAPDAYVEEYGRAFAGLGIGELVDLHLDEREEAESPDKLAPFDGAAGVFFSGGDQLRLVSTLAGTPVWHRIAAFHKGGGLIAGTSAGAAAMGQAMLSVTPGGETPRVGALWMGAGFGLVPGTIIDQHFAQRARIGRLLAGVGSDPALLGLGIDEDTALVVENGSARVIGNGAVCMIDGRNIRHSNLDEANRDETLSLFGVTLHLLSRGDTVDLGRRRPRPALHRCPEIP